MEKLIDLLNEFEEYNKNCEFDEVYNYYPYRVWYEGDFETDLTENCMNIVFIMSKTFGFIKWLVENDKIDFSKVKEKIGLDRELYDRMLYWYKEDDFLIMILSVENEPIRFLCEILK